MIQLGLLGGIICFSCTFTLAKKIFNKAETTRATALGFLLSGIERTRFVMCPCGDLSTIDRNQDMRCYNNALLYITPIGVIHLLIAD